MKFTLGLVVSLGALYLVGAVNYCPPLGPLYEKPQRLSTDPLIRQISKNLTERLKAIVKNRNITVTGFDTNTTSFSLNLFSAHESKSIHQYHYTAPTLNASSTRKVDENSVYRIASISKMITVLALLVQGSKVHFDDRITKYIPELAEIAKKQNAENHETFDYVEAVVWSEITVGALASHLAGVGRSCKRT